jgi:hypothetical protein
MSLGLDLKSTPEGLTVHLDLVTEEVVFTIGGPFGDQELCRMSMKDFLYASAYVLNGSDLWGEKDPRIGFIEAVQAHTIVPGRNPGFKRIALGKCVTIDCPDAPPPLSVYAEAHHDAAALK